MIPAIIWDLLERVPPFRAIERTKHIVPRGVPEGLL